MDPIVKKKKKKLPLALRVIRVLFPITEIFFPSLAKKWAINLFFTPFRFPLNPEERNFVDSCELHKIRVRGIHVKIYAKGSGPIVICQHGWSGCAAQFRIIADELVQSGFKVIMADGPGHGGSEGEQTDLPEITDILSAISSQYANEKIEAFIGHSLGGAAILHGIQTQTLKVPRLILIAAPSHPNNILEIFAERIRASNKCPKYIESFIEHKYGRSLSDFFVSNWSNNSDTPTLIIHDQDDHELPEGEHVNTFQKHLPNNKVIETKGLGHFRIILSQDVASQTREFIAN